MERKEVLKRIRQIAAANEAIEFIKLKENNENTITATIWISKAINLLGTFCLPATNMLNFLRIYPYSKDVKKSEIIEAISLSQREELVSLKGTEISEKEAQEAIKKLYDLWLLKVQIHEAIIAERFSADVKIQDDDDAPNGPNAIIMAKKICPEILKYLDIDSVKNGHLFEEENYDEMGLAINKIIEKQIAIATGKEE